MVTKFLFYWQKTFNFITFINKWSYVVDSFDYKDSTEFNNETAFVAVIIWLFWFWASPWITAWHKVTQDSDYVSKLSKAEFTQLPTQDHSCRRLSPWLSTFPPPKVSLVHFIWLDSAVEAFLVCNYLPAFLADFAFGLGSFGFSYSFLFSYFSLAQSNIKTWAVIY